MKNISGIRDQLIKTHLDALFITNQANISYLTGFAGLSPDEREGFLLLTQKNAYLMLFPTYFGLYTNNQTDLMLLNITQDTRLTNHFNHICQKEKIKMTGYEKDNLTVSELESLQQKLNCKLVPTVGIIEKERIIKDQKEQEAIKKAARITDLAFEYIMKKVKKGKTEKDLSLELEFFIKIHADDIAFSPIVAFDSNAAIPHYLPTHNSSLDPPAGGQLTNHNLILFDFGAKIGNYCSDMTRIVFLGKPDTKFVKIYQTVLKAQEIAVNNLNTLIKKGNNNIRGSSIDKKVKDNIVSQGFPPYPHGLGHGVGIEIHEAPRLKVDNKDILSSGMVFTIEPGIYLPGWGGVRIEDLLMITKRGIEILSKSPKDLKNIIV